MEDKAIRPLLKIVSFLLLFALAPLEAKAGKGGLPQLRADFLAAEQALEQGDKRAYRKLKSGLTQYPLLPYLEYQEIRKDLNKVSAKEVEAFLLQYADTPLPRRLRAAWLDHLAAKKRWYLYLAFYRPSSSAYRQCQYLQALINTKRRGEALDQVKPLWLAGRSRPKVCDPVFKAWRDAGRLTPALVWKRIELAIAKRKVGLARYLQRFLPKQERQWAKLWERIHNHPNKIVTAKVAKVPAKLRNKILLHGIKGLVRKDAPKALEAWKKLKGNYRFSPEERQSVQRAISLALLRQRHPDAFDYVKALPPEQVDGYLHRTLLRRAIAEQAWDQLLHWIGRLSKQERNEDIWRYWQARALAEKGDKKQSLRLFGALANERSYHGFLAADRLGTGYHLDHTALKVMDRDLVKLNRQPGIQRAQELFFLDRLIDARREWEHSIRDLDNTMLQAASKQAQEWGWHDRAIFTLARTGYWDDLELRFPLEHQQPVETHARKKGLDNSWVYAVIRQESAFARDARSPVGALGLMQLMPRTARSVAKALKKRKPRTRDILQPATNIELGTAYLRKVLDKLNQNKVLATAAYNAGPHRVRAWLPADTTPADVWVDSVPFSETRKYLQRVLSYTVIYEKRLGRTPRRLNELMPTIEPPDTRTTGRIKGSKGAG
jgi:soluble lytic murein transglycosylase